MSAHPPESEHDVVTSLGFQDQESGEFGKSVPQALHESVARTATEQITHKWQWIFGFGVFLSCVALLAQYVWFHSVDVVQDLPTMRSEMELFCQGTGCRIPLRRDPTRIRIIDRDVRAHPEYKNALLVSASVVNTLSYVQPFPHMRLMLFDVNGRIIAARIFKPIEYLDSDIDLAGGMGVNEPIQVVLGILAREEAAASFEFTFL
uniref:DUF3426 domain-containing protein n=1 Tax=Candidatus Kentrum sp. MB TaxID=2138164 RepID=A0A450XY63_9GAMM|nr:MAG: Protein of unknown function (DUF3426) [Candidatus Kentron sp. MB]VFK34205.1 MAG: Protein of unknown function (DUF3426) [Candidatus Kentron sp. MB]VFK76460.1 MAG: Protein of unknown function (DUF3426) [Candidatus Kentron sp. MB]